jgi:rhodanese-related sulfurtransferase
VDASRAQRAAFDPALAEMLLGRGARAAREITMTKTLTTDQLEDLMHRGEDFVLVDVLPREQFDRDHIDGSRSAPLDDPNFVSSISGAVAGKKNKKIVVYCASEQCDASTRAAATLEGAGFTNVFDYKGGLDAWHHAEHASGHSSGDAQPASLSSPRRGSARSEADTQPMEKGAATQAKGAGTPASKGATSTGRDVAASARRDPRESAGSRDSPEE